MAPTDCRGVFFSVSNTSSTAESLTEISNSPVSKVLRQLVDSVEVTRDKLDSLKEKIAPVLRPSIPINAPDSKSLDSEGSSPIVYTLGTIYKEILSIHNIMDDIISRVDL